MASDPLAPADAALMAGLPVFPGPYARDVLLIIDAQGQPTLKIGPRADGHAPVAGDPEIERLARSGMAGWNAMLGAISALVLDANERGHAVVILEDAKVPQPTHPAIWHAMGGSPALLVRKYLDDGAPMVLAALSRFGVEPRRVTCCGALTSVCVATTVRGLRKVLGRDRVDVVAEACFDMLAWDEGVMGQ